MFGLKRELQHRQRLLRFVAAYVAVFVVLASFGYTLAGGGRLIESIKKSRESQKFATDLTYYDLPRITVSLSAGVALNDDTAGMGNLPPRLRADVSLEVAKKDLILVEGYQPRITEKLSEFLRTVQLEQIERPNSTIWLRAQMLKIVNNTGVPVPVHDLLFREFVIM